MSKRRKIINIQNICRFCLNDDNEMVELSTPEIKKKVQEFIETTSINIGTADAFPRKICHVCIYKLESWYDFRQQLMKSHSVLTTYIKSKGLASKNPAPTVDPSTVSPSNSTETSNSESKKDVASINGIDVQPGPDNSVDKSLELPSNSCPVSSVDNDDTKGTVTPKLESTSEGKPGLSLSKNRLTSVRRTSEQRLASTQRWVARKRALLAATGENDTDSDSVGSDTAHLSPMKKARVKCNERNDIERRKSELMSVNSYDNDDNNDDNDDVFKPQTVQSEVQIGDTTFVVTSTLFLSEPQFINQPLDSLKQPNNNDDNNDQNMDIIDALQLRRVTDNKIANDKLIEKCLNIEVEGTELEALQKVQMELAAFIETEIEKKLVDKKDQPASSPGMGHAIKQPQTNCTPQDSFQTLEQQLKIIVERAIKKNLDNCKLKRSAIGQIDEKESTQRNNSFPPTLVKAAVKSSIFQPKVLVDRLDPKVLELLAKCENESNNKLDVKENLENHQDLETSGGEKHICGTCGLTFSSKDQVEEHYLVHKRLTTEDDPVKQQKVDDVNNKKPENIDEAKNAAVNKKGGVVASKKNMMRCKCCREIVATEMVKFHLCRNKLHACKTCKQIFRTESSLMMHQKSHLPQQQEEVKIEKVPNVNFNDQNDQKNQNDQIINNINVDVNSSANKIIKSPAPAAKKSEINCFICDKPFDDDDKLKDHLQNHCDDNDDNSNAGTAVKDTFQCAICGVGVESEQKLELHVEQHLFNDVDDKPNSVEAYLDKKSKLTNKILTDNCMNLHSCLQCNKTFESEVKLAFHVQEHEEEAAIAEWENEFKTHQNTALHACTICDDNFENEQALADHFDIHNFSSHICALCDKPFLTLLELQQHVDKHWYGFS